MIYLILAALFIYAPLGMLIFKLLEALLIFPLLLIWSKDDTASKVAPVVAGGLIFAGAMLHGLF